MKKFVSFLLVALLVITSFAMTAQAAETASVSVSSNTNAKAGETVSITYTVNGVFDCYEMIVTYDSRLTLTGISGAVEANQSTGYVAFATGSDATSSSFTATFAVPADAVPGTSYSVGASVIFVSLNDKDANVSVGGGVITVACDHDWSDWTVKTPATCTEDGEEIRTCSICKETESRKIPALGHDMKAEYDATHHWKECSRCDYATDKVLHDLSGEWISTENGHYHKCSGCAFTSEVLKHTGMDKWEKDDVHHWHECSDCHYVSGKAEHQYTIKGENSKQTWDECVCGHKTGFKDKEDDDLPAMYDNTPHLVLGFVAVMFSLVAVVYGVKRKVSK